MEGCWQAGWSAGAAATDRGCASALVFAVCTSPASLEQPLNPHDVFPRCCSEPHGQEAACRRRPPNRCLTHQLPAHFPRPRAPRHCPCRKEGTVQRQAVEGEQTKTGMQKETASAHSAGWGSVVWVGGGAVERKHLEACSPAAVHPPKIVLKVASPSCTEVRHRHRCAGRGRQEGR